MESAEAVKPCEIEPKIVGKSRILVVDDEQLIRDLLKRILDNRGYEVVVASDGIEALRKIKEAYFDLMIMDLKMPRMAGMELLERVRRIKEDLLVIVITGHGTIETAKEAMKQGCVDYITKPFDVEDILFVIRRAFEMRELIRDKRELQVQLEIAERLASLAKMGAGIVHEVNTVLTSVKLFLEILQPYLLNSEEERRGRLILEEIGRAEKLIRRFLDFVKPPPSEFTKVDINRIIVQSLHFLHYRFTRQKIEVSQILSPNLPLVFCDSAEMEEVFLNIFSNSADAMPEGGDLIVKSESAEGKVIVTVTDTGVGIPQEDIPQIYTPFFTTKLQGTGLGLSIVHRIIDEHQGIISITSKESEGTIVRIELSAAE